MENFVRENILMSEENVKKEAIVMEMEDDEYEMEISESQSLREMLPKPPNNDHNIENTLIDESKKTYTYRV